MKEDNLLVMKKLDTVIIKYLSLKKVWLERAVLRLLARSLC